MFHCWCHKHKYTIISNDVVFTQNKDNGKVIRIQDKKVYSFYFDNYIPIGIN